MRAPGASRDPGDAGVILGTAGHIDHGKTALIKALTGVDTDRLPEERRRGITIELGFAPLPIEGVGVVGVVDVPGHEAFVRTMLAGATGIDLALVVVAADESVMPQTREHLAILSLLGVERGVVALTKADLVDADWLELVAEDVAAATAHTTLAGAEAIPVSALTGQGLDDLRAAIGRAAARVPSRDAADLFRLPVDRAFTVKGTGTVVTGTVWSGQLRRDDVVRVLPGAGTARVRGLQSHGAPVEVAGPGIRIAVNLAGVDVADVPRGSTLVTDATWGSVQLLRADVEILADAPIIKPRAKLRFHLGTRDVGARVVARGGSLGPGMQMPVRVALDEPITARGGDRFVLRTASPSATVGGGIVTDPLPAHRRSKPWPSAGEGPLGWINGMAREAGVRGIPLASLPVRVGLRPGQAERAVLALEKSGEVLKGTLYDRTAIAEASDRLLATIDAHHARAPLEEGLSLQSLRAALPTSPELSDALLERLALAGAIAIDHGLVRRAGWVVRPSPSQQLALDHLAAAVKAGGREPPNVSELAASGGGVVNATDNVTTLLRLLERRGMVKQVEQDRFYSVEALAELTKALRDGMASGRDYSPSELRELLGVSRKYLIPLLEYYDRLGITERRAEGRVLSREGGKRALVEC
jgi:selenocysteine-specific elongation factor